MAAHYHRHRACPQILALSASGGADFACGYASNRLTARAERSAPAVSNTAPAKVVGTAHSSIKPPGGRVRGGGPGRSGPRTAAGRVATGGKHAPARGKRAPSRGKRAPVPGKRAPVPGKRAPARAGRAFFRGERAPAEGMCAPARGKRAPAWGKRAPAREERAPARAGRAFLRAERAPAGGMRAPARIVVSCPSSVVAEEGPGGVSPLSIRVLRVPHPWLNQRAAVSGGRLLCVCLRLCVSVVNLLPGLRLRGARLTAGWNAPHLR
jgi:hypothetical protein